MQDKHVIGEVDVGEEKIKERPEDGSVGIVRQLGCADVEEKQREASKDRTSYQSCLLDIGLGCGGSGGGVYNGSRRGVHYFHAGED